MPKIEKTAEVTLGLGELAALVKAHVLKTVPGYEPTRVDWRVEHVYDGEYGDPGSSALTKVVVTMKESEKKQEPTK